MQTVRTVLRALAGAAFAGALLPAQAQGFVNLDFEAAQIPAEAGTHLPWETTVPGWNHSSGADTGLVFYGTVHAGTTQWFRLVDAELSEQPLAGRFSLSFASGYAVPQPPFVDWVRAWISQSAVIPTDAQSIRLTATGSFAVQIAGATIPLVAGPGNQWLGDIAAFAGQFAELRVVNLTQDFHTPVTVDDIQFSTSPVPEPGSAALLLAGLALLAKRRR